MKIDPETDLTSIDSPERAGRNAVLLSDAVSKSPSTTCAISVRHALQAGAHARSEHCPSRAAVRHVSPVVVVVVTHVLAASSNNACSRRRLLAPRALWMRKVGCAHKNGRRGAAGERSAPLPL
jgi:hypothetical protein